MVDPDRLSAAYSTARCDLLAESATAGHWIGELSSSALSTATAISALALVERHAPTVAGRFADENRECRLSELIMASVRWLAKHQNSDGGWGDTDKSLSNVATTMLVRSAFALTAVPANCPGLLERADAYIKAQGGIAGLRRRYGKDKTFAVPILTNCALAGLVPWRKVPALPFELACFSQKTWKLLRLPVVSYAIPALVAIGQARYFHRKPRNPIMRLLRGAALGKSLRVLETLQPKSGGFLEATPLTSFVVMSLASIGRTEHPVVRKGVEFLLASVRPDGSWPIDTNLATWNTTLAVNALASAGEDVSELSCLDWVLACQHREVHPYTGADPGGWAWTDLSGGVPDVDDTSGALLALAAWSKADPDAEGKLPFDRSGADLTAHALRALHAWRTSPVKVSAHSRELSGPLEQRMRAATERGFRYLIKHQHPDGYWQPLWFGNQHRPEEDNPIYGTAKVLAAFRDFGRLDNPAVGSALDWLMTMKHADGSWGGDVGADAATAKRQASVEETALATEVLLTCGMLPAHETAALQGVKWLVDAVEANRHQDSSPIGFYFAKLWYYEKLYPLVSTVAALGQAARRLLPQPEPPSVVHLGKP